VRAIILDDLISRACILASLPASRDPVTGNFHNQEVLPLLALEGSEAGTDKSSAKWMSVETKMPDDILYVARGSREFKSTHTVIDGKHGLL
jgi:hypothetical protein